MNSKETTGDLKSTLDSVRRQRQKGHNHWQVWAFNLPWLEINLFIGT